jgi:PAS domain S-box-containing protein
MNSEQQATKAKILIVEDEALIGLDLKTRLSNWGYTVLNHAFSAEKALALIEQNPPDLVLMDIVTQGKMDGIEAADIIRTRWGIPVIFTTAYADMERIKRAKLTYPFGYLIKPYQDRDIEVTIEMALYTSRVDGERIKIEEDLRQSQKRLRVAQNLVKTGYWEWNLKSGDLFWEEENYRLWGLPMWSPPSLEVFLNSIHPDDRAFVEKSIEDALKGKPYNIVMRIFRPNGEERVIKAYGEVEFDEEGKPEQFFGIVSDITEAIRAEEKNKEQERLNQQLLDSLPCVAILMRSHTREVVAINQAARDAGCRMGKTCFETWPQFDNPCPWCLAPNLWAEGKAQRCAVEALGVIWDANWIPVSDDLYLHYAFDITDLRKREKELRVSEEQHQMILQTAMDGFWITDMENRLLEVNESYSRMSGYSPEELLSMTVSDLDTEVTGEDIAKLKKEVMKQSRIGFQARHRRKDGSFFDVEVNVQNLPIEGGRFVSFIKDISERKRAEEDRQQSFAALNQRTLELQALFEEAKIILEEDSFMTVARSIFDAACRMTGAQSGYVALLSEDGQENEVVFLESGGLPCSVDTSLSMPIRGLRSEAYHSGLSVSDNDFMNSKWAEFMPPGHVALKNVLFAPLNLEGKTVGIMGLANKTEDFTDDDRKVAGAFGQLAAIALKNSQHLEKLKKSEEKYQALFEKMLDGFALHEIICDPQGNPVDYRFLKVNPAFENLTGLKAKEIEGRTVREILPEIEEYWIETYGKVALTGEPAFFENYTKELDKYYEVTAFRPAPNQFACIFTDITERKKATENVKASLREKEILLKEIHHRVKNNLAVIGSILSLQSQYVNDKKALEVFQECQNRVKTMSLIHSKLYQTKDLAHIDIGSYCKELTETLFMTYQLNSSSLSIRHDIDPIQLNINTSIPLGLILNELVSNALKYAFPDGRQGTLEIGVKKDNGQIVLTVADDGIGFPEDMDFTQMHSLGLQLVNGLVRQLRGNIEIERGCGTVFKVRFSE